MPTIKLTDAFVKAFKAEPGQRIAEVRDGGEPGLELRASASGTKSWRYHYTRRADGKRRAVHVGRYPAISLQRARQIARKYRVGVEDESQRSDPAGDVQARKRADTFADLADEWMSRKAAKSRGERTRLDDQSALKLHILPEIGGMKAAEITKRDINRLLDGVSAKPDARSGRAGARMKHRPHKCFEVIRAVYRWAVGVGELDVDPTAGMKPGTEASQSRERELSPDEIRQLWAALERAPEAKPTTKGLPLGQKAVAPGELPMLRATALALKLALVTGQRIGEVAGTAIAELELNSVAPVWTIPSRRSKNRQAHRVPLSALAVRLIGEARALAPDSPWLFPNPEGRGPISAHAPTRALARARPAIGLPDFRVHDLRRTAATRMAEMGIAPHTISLVLNHVSARKGTITGKVYVQYSYDREKREALEAWGARLERIVAGTDGENVVGLAAARRTAG
jgi:integrase